MEPTRRPGLITRTVDGETVILDRAAGQVHRLNVTATCVWDGCDGRSTPWAIARQLAARFGQQPEDVLPDVTAMLRTLEELGLLERPQQA